MITPEWYGRRGRRILLRQTQPEFPPTTSTVTPQPTSTQGSLDLHDTATTHTPIIAITAASLAAIILVICVITFLRSYREKNHAQNEKPNNFLMRLRQRWSKNPSRYEIPGTTEQTETTIRPTTTNAATEGSVEMGNRLSRDAVSIRSVITLPAYIQTARQNECVLGREGERAGIDVVVEFPDLAEEEQRREDEMEALYQVRLARRRENEAREERRRHRRDARERGECVEARDIEESAQRASNGSSGQTIEELRAEHDRLKRLRQRTVSVVSYAEIGVARHDGTRLSINSQENERTGLLGEAGNASPWGLAHRPGSIVSNHTTNSEMHLNPTGTGDITSSPPQSHSWNNSRTSLNRRRASDIGAISHLSTYNNSNASPTGLPEYENIPLADPVQPMEPLPMYSGPIGRGTQWRSSGIENETASIYVGESSTSREAWRTGDTAHTTSNSRRNSNSVHSRRNSTSIQSRRNSTSYKAQMGLRAGAVTSSISNSKSEHLPSIEVDPGSPA
ncbi:BgTH12-03817 [Blumeria graminis f. sp. triticale]|uniref:BgtA-21324 n=3 Tax=Blumeria graminis TaxID=34373 RepID=A0A9X9L8Q5_BLUGR|nr:hypothetical protein BGT96224_A21324 [Blumeria graminis f. sp. tritici 96224]CAD6499709.1 BgTH12-03817 [Blumeria graminis f. sp. triticale]VCU39877.1 BgtA-21324 [Blumeria graminis f. sp. tritici]